MVPAVDLHRRFHNPFRCRYAGLSVWRLLIGLPLRRHKIPFYHTIIKEYRMRTLTGKMTVMEIFTGAYRRVAQKI
jgi:hypothetical protein